MENGKRLLFFDILRIVSVALIIFCHIATVYHWRMFFGPTLFHIFYLNTGVVGVALLIFVSGAVLEFSHPNLSGNDEIFVFYVKRLFRIYPAFWMSMVIGLAFSAYLIYRPILITFLEFSGFNAWSGGWGGLINPCGWFVGLIVALYFLFPFLSAFIKRYPWQMLCLIAVAEIFSRYALATGHIQMLAGAPDRWFPFCNLLEFSLGIWVVQQGIYPKWTHDNVPIRFFADISFYAFLIHYVAGMKLLIAASFSVYFIAVSMLAWLMMLGDQKVQGWLKKRIINNTS